MLMVIQDLIIKLVLFHCGKQGANYSMNNSSGSDLSNIESAIDPTAYDVAGDIEVKTCHKNNFYFCWVYKFSTENT